MAAAATGRHRRSGIWAVALALFAGPLTAEPDPATQILDLVRESLALERDHAFGPAAARLTPAIDMLRAQSGYSRHDLATLSWRRAFLSLRAFETDTDPACDAPLPRILDLAETARAEAAQSGDPLLQGRTDQVLAAVALASGAYDRAGSAAREAGEALAPRALCDAAASARIGTQAALLSRDTARAEAALDQAAAWAAAGQCPAADLVQDRVLAARIDTARGDFQAARTALEALRADPAVQAQPLVLGSVLYNLSEVALMRGLYAEAELLNDEARAAFGPLPALHPVLAQIDHRAAIIRQELGDPEAAGAAYDNALERLECRVGPAHPAALALRRESALLLSNRGDASDAINRARAAQASAAAAGAGAYDQALNQAALGLVLARAGGQADAADAALETALRAFAALPRSDLDQTPALLARADLALARGDPADAEAFARRASAILTDNGSASVQRLGQAHRLLAQALIAQGRPDAALDLARANRARIETRIADTARLATYTSELAPDEIRAQIDQVAGLLWDRIAARPDGALEDELFRTLQVVHLTGNARATTGLADALLARDPALAAQAAAERALLAQIEGLERALRSEPPGARRDRFRDAIRTARDDLAALRAGMPDTPLAAEYRRNTASATIGLPEARAALDPGQALWLQASFDRQTYTFLITPEGARLSRTPLSAAALEDHVQALRAAVEPPPGRPPEAASFPVASAHALYCALFLPPDPGAACPSQGTRIGAVNLPQGTELFLIPDRAMQQMAMAVLLTEPLAPRPDFAALGRAAWFARRFPHQTAPSVAAFAGRTRGNATVAAARPFVGFAPFGPFRAGLCDAARQPEPRPAAASGALGLIDPARARGQARLPRTVELVRTAAAHAVAAENRDWFTCEAATEAQIKAQDLTSVDTVLLATHAEVGDLAADLPEPGLFLAAPAAASPRDDGYLKASEIAQMTINANLVILSACSTGSDSGLPGASGLSGLARAFFRAGAHALIVSHWDVAAVSTSALFEALMAERDRGRGALSKDLQAAMIRVMETPGAPVYAHPFVWAPFTVVVGR
ncbi:MAG: CHAT domain-containing protein [Rhodobacteraceae bacterium]|nr:CHAT domain-containing protein [Paracoccaceae bacterium]